MIERKNYGITTLCESGKGKFICGAADFSAAARRGHGFHTGPTNSTYNLLSYDRFAIGYHWPPLIPKAVQL